MSLKPDREILQTSIQYFMTQTSEPGFVVSAISGLNVWPNGAAMDDIDSRASIAATAIGARPLGVLLNRVVNIDLSRQVLNPYKPLESQINDKCVILRKGWIVTNAIGVGEASGVAVPCTGFLGNNGVILTAQGWNASGFPVVGRVLTNVDSDGFAKVEINL